MKDFFRIIFNEGQSDEWIGISVICMLPGFLPLPLSLPLFSVGRLLTVPSGEASSPQLLV